MSANDRNDLAVLALTEIAQVTQLAEQQGVRRQFIYRQKHMAEPVLPKNRAWFKTNGMDAPTLNGIEMCQSGVA